MLAIRYALTGAISALATFFGGLVRRVGVTSAVYVTPEEIQAGGRFLSDVLAQGLGIGGR